MAEKDEQGKTGGCEHRTHGVGFSDFTPRPPFLPPFVIVGLVAAALCVIAIGIYMFSSMQDMISAVPIRNDSQSESWVEACGDVRCPVGQSCILTERGAMCVTLNGVRTP